MEVREIVKEVNKRFLIIKCMLVIWIEFWGRKLIFDRNYRNLIEMGVLVNIKVRLIIIIIIIK